MHDLSSKVILCQISHMVSEEVNVDYTCTDLHDSLIGLCYSSTISRSMLYIVDYRYLEVEGPSETVRDIRTSTYQICSIEENTG